MAAISNNKIIGVDRSKFFKVIGVFVIVVIGLIVVLLKVVRGGEAPLTGMATFVAKRGPLTISVPEAGTIKASQQETIKNEMEGRTSIIYLIPEGTRVKKDELLVKLDASTLQDLKIDQEIKVMNAEAAYINAKETLDIVKNQSQSDIDTATLTFDFAKLDLTKYTDPNGQYRNELVTAQNDIRVADEEKTRADETLIWSQRLFQEKYISQTELQADNLAVTRSKAKLEVAQNSLELLEKFSHKRQLALLDSNVKQAQMALERAQAKARATIAQAEATLKAAEQEYERQKGKLAKIGDQLTKAERKAPVDGMVIYATSVRGGGFGRENRQPLDEGVEVFERQDLIYLPTTASAMAEVDVHESSLEKVKIGLPAIVTVDALPGKKFVGTVGRIAPLPNPQSMWMNPDLKVYTTEIHLEGNDPALRSGMSCKADIIVEQYQDVVYIPVHAVLRVGGKHTVYVVKDGKLEERTVEIGMDNNRMVKITSGLNEGEVVSLTPPLKASTVEAISQMPGAGSSDANDTTMEKINEKLKAINGTKTGMPIDVTAGSPQGGRERGMEAGRDEAGRQRTAAGEGTGMPSQEQMEQMKRRFENMTPEERQKEMEKMKERLQGLTPEEREKIRQQRSRGEGSSGQGRGPRSEQQERNQ